MKIINNILMVHLLPLFRSLFNPTGIESMIEIKIPFYSYKSIARWKWDDRPPDTPSRTYDKYLYLRPNGDIVYEAKVIDSPKYLPGLKAYRYNRKSLYKRPLNTHREYLHTIFKYTLYQTITTELDDVSLNKADIKSSHIKDYIWTIRSIKKKLVLIPKI